MGHGFRSYDMSSFGESDQAQSILTGNLFQPMAYVSQVTYLLPQVKRLSKEVGKQYFRVTVHNNTSEQNWPWWRVVCDFTLHNNTSEKNWPWWRVVWDFTLHNITSEKSDLDEGWCATLHYITIHTTYQYIRKELTLMKGGVRLREVVTKRGGDKGRWRLWEVVTKGVWWLFEVVTTGSVDEGKCWWRECWETHSNGCMNAQWALFWGGSRSTKPCIFPCKLVAAGDEKYLVCVRRVLLRSFLSRIGSSSVCCNEWLCLCA